MPKVSVVVPVYNVEPYIERCLHSLFAQTLDDIEYIFVDDCSSDKSCELIYRVLEEYPDRASQTKVVRHERNMGVAAARTDGILAATGQYIIHCDPDDYVDTDMYEQMYTEAVKRNVDIVICDSWKESPGEKMVIRFFFDGSPSEYLKMGYYYNMTWANLWNKLIRRSLIEKYEILPYPGCDHGEDIGCMVRILYYAGSMYNLRRPLYHYCLRPTSLTGIKVSYDWFRKGVKLAEYIQEFLKEEEYGLLCSRFKFNIKLIGRHFFDGREQEWFALFKECHGDILKFAAEPLRVRLLWWIALRDVRVYKFMKKIVKSLG